MKYVIFCDSEAFGKYLCLTLSGLLWLKFVVIFHGLHLWLFMV